MTEKFLTASAAAVLLARAMICKPQEREAFWSGTRVLAQQRMLRPDGSEIINLISKEADLFDGAPWSSAEANELAGSIPAGSPSEANKLGLFGTAVGVDKNGGPQVRVYASKYGEEGLLRNDTFLKLWKNVNVDLRIVRVQAISFARSRSCGGGSSVSALRGSETGTLGGWLKRVPSGEFVGISNNHVVADLNRFSPPNGVIEPGYADGGTHSDVVGNLKGVVALKPFDPLDLKDSVNLVDVAWLSPTDSRVVDRQIACRKQLPRGEEDLTALVSNSGPVDVCLCGRTSGDAQGQVVAAPATVFFHQSGTDYYFEQQLELTMDKLGRGDSGSLLMTSADDKIGGLFFCFSEGTQIGWANTWQAVKNATGLAFSYA